MILWLAPFIAAAQQYRAQANQASNQAQGSLTITCTVVASAELVIGADGEQHLVVANAVAPADKMLNAQKGGGSPEPEHASPKREHGDGKADTSRIDDLRRACAGCLLPVLAIVGASSEELLQLLLVERAAGSQLLRGEHDLGIVLHGLHA